MRKLIKPKCKIYSNVKGRALGSGWINTSLGYSRIFEGKFVFLNKFGHSVMEEDKWNDGNQDKLWLYNLHYFDDLCSEDSSSRLLLHKSLVSNWISSNSPGEGNGWEPYPTSLRIVNWIKWFLNGTIPEQEWLDSLACQAHWLKQDLEFFILGNHLFANAKALVFAGAYLDVPEANDWLRKGLSILENEIPEQVLSDGANFELSPMYHAIVLTDLLDLINLAQSSANKSFSHYLDSWKKTASMMLGWFKKMCHPDGDLSFFNDAAVGIAYKYDELFRYAHQMGIEVITCGKVTGFVDGTVCIFPESRYVVVEAEEYKAILDCACIGPDYLPGHAHADTLSFELSLLGQRLFVNSGTSCYGTSSERVRQRGTSAHNTVVVDGQNSSEVWSGFRVARRAYPGEININTTENELFVKCSHDGYLRLKGKVIHQREWQFRKKSIQITDRLQGVWTSATAYFYLHPGIAVKDMNGKLILELSCGKTVTFISEAKLSVESSFWQPEFGVSVDNKRIIVQFDSPVLRTKLNWN